MNSQALVCTILRVNPPPPPSGGGMILEDRRVKRKIGDEKASLFHPFFYFLPKNYFQKNYFSGKYIKYKFENSRKSKITSFTLIIS